VTDTPEGLVLSIPTISIAWWTKSGNRVRVIVDTNIWVSGLISDRGAPARVVDTVLKGEIVPVMSEATFAELEDVLHRPPLQAYFRRAAVTPLVTCITRTTWGGTRNKKHKSAQPTQFNRSGRVNIFLSP
jgi:hypothetical protein